MHKMRESFAIIL